MRGARLTVRRARLNGSFERVSVPRVSFASRVCLQFQPMLRIVRFALPLAFLAAPGGANNDDKFEAGADQVGLTVHYHPDYRKLAFPGGDVPSERGVCTDVVVRALRAARSMDLQALVNADLRTNWDAYPHPQKWRLSE